MKEIRVFCPGTIANVSCGFDVLGLCLGHIGDEMVIRKATHPGVKIVKITGQNLPMETHLNVAGVAANALLEALKTDQGFEIEIYKKIKPGSGIGSSAASAAGVVYGINKLLGDPLSTQALIPFAMKGEELASGALHADNVAPALLGGFTLVRGYEPLEVIKLPTPEALYATVIHPQIELKTADARAVLKKNIPLEKAIVQWGNLAGFISALYTSDYALLSRCLRDVVIEPLRGPLIPGFEELKKIADTTGALGSGISGSGPSVYALSQGKNIADKTAAAMSDFYSQIGVEFEVHVSKISQQGIQVMP